MKTLLKTHLMNIVYFIYITNNHINQIFIHFFIISSFYHFFLIIISIFLKILHLLVSIHLNLQVYFYLCILISKEYLLKEYYTF